MVEVLSTIALFVIPFNCRSRPKAFFKNSAAWRILENRHINKVPDRFCLIRLASRERVESNHTNILEHNQNSGGIAFYLALLLECL
jgi:hypothetical protein